MIAGKSPGSMLCGCSIISISSGGTRVYSDCADHGGSLGGRVKAPRDEVTTAGRVWTLSSVEPRLVDMSGVLAIGEFSRITHLSIKTLRRYHEGGLLEPATVDRDTGYRYYSLDQVPTAQVIHRFRRTTAAFPARLGRAPPGPRLDR